jgi:hypothetical protein
MDFYLDGSRIVSSRRRRFGIDFMELRIEMEDTLPWPIGLKVDVEIGR